MKNLFLLALTLTIFSCEQPKQPEYVIFNGTIKNSVAEEAILSGKGFKTTLPISTEGKFTDTLDIERNGYYDLYINRERTAVYLEKGKHVTVTLDAFKFDESLIYGGSLAPENNYLAAKFLMDEKFNDFETLYKMEPALFSEALSAQNERYDSLLKASNIKNKTFLNMEQNENKFAHATNLESYEEYHMHFTKKENFAVPPQFYEKLKDINYSDTTLFRSSVAYQSLLSTHYGRIAAQKTKKDSTLGPAKSFLTTIDSNLPDGFAKDKLMTDYLRFGLKSDDELEELFSIYKNSNPSEENLAILTERYNKLKTLTRGNVSPEFNYENHKGGTTSLTDLKGKYVYIDVWATWCGPCIREIPSLQEVEEAYSGKNVAFVSISIDVPKDYETWKSMVSEKELGGIQLLADNNWKSKFVQDYGIQGIPRFILLDPEGNIVSADAPRPSDTNLRILLDGLI
ncbi:TlpA family protein disulfide reductase [Cochleicola gelatinilyticus]|uniref:Thiol-disulfide isomerase n=1 Tax=Cochleicola gelatinilyticus TaxID=1763537 RepID=A0A167HUX9_9FLAO|nr:TlpA disulfide reductase family protein [Cochleicola gelatinilyticus]OAB78987.1 thiol-disulfide isomerase [Cochleicola gelatinilyticus]